ncbi:MAG TPA: hypothetical protein VEW74_03430 [Candidatus Nitrosotalea sp.]|nr:hypothetical protein [Candidatus Nitrosotalea sp.]
MRSLSHTSLYAVVSFCVAVGAVSVAGCGSSATPSAAGVPLSVWQRSVPATLPKEPIVVTFDSASGGLAYWPMRSGGGQQLQPLSGPLGIHNVYALAADGDVVIIANYNPAELVAYDVRSKGETTLADPFGGPVDVAVGRDGKYYALNLASVTVFKPGSSSEPYELTCPDITNGQAIAVDNEGDVFVNGLGKTFMGVVEYPAGSAKCVRPHLRTERGYPAGVGVDPKTDDLIVVDDPDLCAGGLEGRMIIYPRPFAQRTSIRRVLGATYCAGNFRLDARSKMIFYADASVSDGIPIIDQARFPSAKSEGQYWLGYYSSQYFSGITTIPNALPN